jgi:putative ABC transport system permease protein
MALGSTPAQVRRLVMLGGIRVTFAGLIVGMASAAAMASAMRAVLFGVAPLDPLVMAAVATLLLTVVMAANYFPARRATRIDPMQALHHD